MRVLLLQAFDQQCHVTCVICTVVRYAFFEVGLAALWDSVFFSGPVLNEIHLSETKFCM